MNRNVHMSSVTAETKVRDRPFTPAQRVQVRQQKAIKSRLEAIMDYRYYPSGCTITLKYSPAYTVCDIAHIWGFAHSHGHEIANVECMIGLEHSDTLNLNTRLNNMFLATEIHRALDAGAILLSIGTASLPVIQQLDRLITHNEGIVRAKGSPSGRIDILKELAESMPALGWHYCLISKGMAPFERIITHEPEPEPDFTTSKMKPSPNIRAHAPHSLPQFFSHVSPVFVALDIHEKVKAEDLSKLAELNGWSQVDLDTVESLAHLGDIMQKYTALESFKQPRRRSTRQGDATVANDNSNDHYISPGELARRRMNSTDLPNRPVTPNGRFIGSRAMYDPSNHHYVDAASESLGEQLRTSGFNDEEVAGWNDREMLYWEEENDMLLPSPMHADE